MKTAVIHQPDFMPHLGFFHRFLHADMYVALDHVQFVNGSSKAWTHRDKIKTAQGEKWLTVSTRKAPRDTALNQIELAPDAGWRRDNLALLEQNYRAAPFYSEVMPRVEQLYARPVELLRDFNMASIEFLMDMLDVRLPWVYSSALQPAGSSNELLVDIMQKVEAKRYLSGVGARAYFDPTPFAQAGIEVIWQEFSHPVYSQQFGEFLPYLSTLDVLMNHGAQESRKILRSCK